MVRIMKTTLTALVVVLVLAVGQSQAGLVYEFSGFLPDDIDEPDFFFDRDLAMRTGPDTVELGDSWTLTVAIDLVDDVDPGDPNYGDYVDAATSGKLVFSSGYEATFTSTRTWGDIFVLDNLISAGLPEVDGVAVSMAGAVFWWTRESRLRLIWLRFLVTLCRNSPSILSAKA